ncbi:hypothetical protein Hanom_Chr16g01522711 [Helianthus anomalus]
MTMISQFACYFHSYIQHSPTPPSPLHHRTPKPPSPLHHHRSCCDHLNTIHQNQPPPPNPLCRFLERQRKMSGMGEGIRFGGVW